jgi:hypothetical protein
MQRCSIRVRALVPALALVLGACGGTSSSSLPPTSNAGALLEGPAGGLFFVDPHQSGQARSPRLAETAWGRLVNVHDADAGGVRGLQPVLVDVPVHPDLVSDGLDFALESDTLGRTRLVILHPRGTLAFERALRSAAQELPTLASKDDDGASSPPFPLVARDAAIVLRFDDLLIDTEEVREGLAESVRLLVGYPPRARHHGRVFFDAAHGALSTRGFHPTRVVIDVTVSAFEPPAPFPLPLNPIGLPASLEATAQPNLSVRVATREDFGSSVFTVLRNLRGRALNPLDNGPDDPASVTLDVVRALRSGNRRDPFNGFLPDLVRPTLLGRFAAVVRTAVAVPGEPGAFELRLAYASACATALVPGELLETGAGLLLVTKASAPPDPDGEIAGLRVRIGVGTSGVPSLGELLGEAHVLTTLAASPGLAPECFVEVLGAGVREPGAPIASDARFRLRFSEPMDTDSFDPFDSLLLYAGVADATRTVVSAVSAAPDGTTFDLAPLLPLAHTPGEAERYTFELLGGSEGVTDLAGNALELDLPALAFELAPDAPAVASGGISLRFAALDEYAPAVPTLEVPAAREVAAQLPPVRSEDVTPGGPDLRGTHLFDFARGVLRPRPISHRSFPIDGTSGVTSRMLPLQVGIREPLSRSGSRFQTLWRYADAGMRVEDETHYDLDVAGLAWAPFGGGVIADFFERFEVRLGHSVQVPDEALVGGTLFSPDSGLRNAPARFDDNVVEPGGARPVSLRAAGYRIEPSRRFQATTGTLMLPFPLHTASGLAPFLWRDTALLGRGGFGGVGVPLGIERTLDPTIVPGSFAPVAEVPTVGLPLLIELRAFASDRTLGLNDFQVAIAAAGQLFPTFRVHSTGGRNLASSEVVVDPDASPVPTGGFDASSSPPGQPTRSADPSLYFGQLDTVTRVTRVHSVWFDTGSVAPDYVAPLVLPAPESQPVGTQVVLEYRGAHSFLGTRGAELDARQIDAYGELMTGAVAYVADRSAWTRDLDELDGARHFQVRITLASDVEREIYPELDSLAFAFLR